MDATFFQKCDNLSKSRDLAGQYGAVVDSRQVRMALRKLRTDANLTPEEFADEASVNRATVYRIEDMDSRYGPKVETISALVASRGLSLTEFFARIEGVTQAVLPSDQGSTANEALHQGGRDVPASPVESDRLSRLEAEIATLKAEWRGVRDVTRSLFETAVVGAKGRTAAVGSTRSRRRARKIS